MARKRPPGPGWWLASDGRWYPPASNPALPPPPSASPLPPPPRPPIISGPSLGGSPETSAPMGSAHGGSGTMPPLGQLESEQNSAKPPLHKQPWVWVLLAIVGALFVASLAGGSQDDSNQARPLDQPQSGIEQWSAANQGFGSEFVDLSATFNAAGNAASRGDMSALRNGCREFGAWAQRVGNAYDPPLAGWDGFLRDLRAASSSCLAGDYETAGRKIDSVNDRIDVFSAQLP